jgi:hypothetical protein
MNKYTTQREMFKLSIIQVCIRYKMGKLSLLQSYEYLNGYGSFSEFERVYIFLIHPYRVYNDNVDPHAVL